MEFRILDANAPPHGVSLKTLMSNAARACAEVATKRFAPTRVLLLCGPGNNGGDGYAMASLLAADAEVSVVVATKPKTEEAKWAFGGLDRGRIHVEPFRDVARLKELLRDADLVIDALMGSGIHGELRAPFDTIVRAVNASRRPVLSIDVPTGFGGKLAIRPAATVALHEKKTGMTPTNSGAILVRDIGIPEAAATEVGPGDFTATYPRNGPDSHKGMNGRVLVVAGGPYTGAPILCALAALRSGVDLVRLYGPSDSTAAAQVVQPDLIVHPGVEPRRLVVEAVHTHDHRGRHVERCEVAAPLRDQLAVAGEHDRLGPTRRDVHRDLTATVVLERLGDARSPARRHRRGAG